MKKAVIFCDGASSGNPGPAGIGAVIKIGGDTVELSEHIGTATNNAAEYKALISAIKKALELKAEEVTAYLDSELLVKQLNGEYRVKNKGLLPLYGEAVFLLKRFKCYTINHVPREENREADALAKKASLSTV